MGPTLPLDQRALSSNRGRHHQQQSSSGNGNGNGNSNASSKPASREHSSVKSSTSRTSLSFAGDLPYQSCLPAPGLSPLPSTSTMPLSLQQLGSAASSTDSLNAPASVPSHDGISRSYITRHHHAGSQSSVRIEPSNSHITANRGQVTLVHPHGTGAGRPSGLSASSGHAGQEYNRPPVSSYGSKRNDPSPSIYSTSSARSTSSVNSLPPASESSLSASTVMYAHSDPKGKGRSTLTPTGPIAVSSKKRVPSAIEEAVRNLGLPPPGPVNSSYLSVPGPRVAGGSPHLELSRTASANTSATSDAASLSGTVASSTGSTSKDGQSLSSKQSAKSATSKTKKKKIKPVPIQPTVTTTVIKASSSARPTATSASTSTSTTEAKVKKKKKAAPLPTSSGRSPIVPQATSAPPPTSSPAPSSPQPAAQPAQTRPARNVRPTATSPNPTPNHTVSNTSNVPLHRPGVQAVPSRNRHLDESALLRRFPETSATSTSPPTTQVHIFQASDRQAIDPTQSSRSPSQAPATMPQASATSTAPAATEASTREEPAPPPWSPPLETITLAFTPIHAYLSAYHDPVDQPIASTSQSTAHPPVPDSPPPAFRSRSPSPETGPPTISSNRRPTSLSSSDNASLPDVDLDALEERSRGYASSENEIDLLNSQGRHSGTSTPPVDGAHGDSTKGLRWQLRHWEAWRREGVSLEDRLQRLRQWNSPTQEQASSSSPPVLTPTRSTESVADASHTDEAAALQTPLETARVASAGLQPSPHITSTDRQPSPVRSDLSHLAGSGSSQPRFPSVGTVRRARLQRFEAERQHTKSMSAVVQSSPATSSVGLPRQGSAHQNQQAPASVPPTSASTAESEHSREQVRLAMLQAALDRHATIEIPPVAENLADQPQAEDALRPSEASRSVETPTMPISTLAETADASTSDQSVDSAKSTHKLARQLAAEVEAKRTSSASDEASRALAGFQPDPAAELPARSDSRTAQKPAIVGVNQSPSKVKTAASRISRIFRPNMGPRPQPARKVAAEQETSITQEVAVTEASQADRSTLLPVMTLPKAPPRLTTDPLSTDNLRKLSRRQLRSPSVHGAASVSSSSSEDESSSPSTSEDQNSDSGSDSADDESTKKPPSTISHLGPRAPPSVGASTVYAHESEREAAAATWRRTEDGRRHSAILSRPLSIKRKPPPVPPKRWGGVWDRDAIQERLRRSFNLLDDDEQASPVSDSPTRMQGSRVHDSGRQVMPGTLATVTEDEHSWEVVGQNTAPAASTSSASWEVVGQNEGPSSRNDDSRFFARAQPTGSGRQSQSNPPYQHMYSEADFSNSRRLPPPPPPRFPPASDDLALQASMPKASEADSLASSTIPTRPAPATRSSLQRTSAVRRPQSMMGGQQRAQSSEGNPRASPESVRSSPPSPEIRTRLSTRPRHVYSASVPNADLAQAQPPPGVVRRPLPPLPAENSDLAPRSLPRSERMSFNTVPSVSEPASARDSRNSATAQHPIQEYTDLEVMLASMDDRAPGSSSEVLREVLGVSQPATAEEIDSLPVGRVELERRRVDKKGRIKQKMSCVGINCNKCKICLQQFKEDELAVVLPVCLEVFHAEPCMRAYLATNNRCPSCRAALM